MTAPVTRPVGPPTGGAGAGGPTGGAGAVPGGRPGRAGRLSGAAAGPPASAARRTFRSAAWVLLIALVIILGGALITLLAPPAPAWPLDPASTVSDGGHALAAVLAERGVTVTRTTTAAETAAADRRASATVLVTSPWRLTPGQLATLSHLPGPMVIAGPDPEALRVLAPAVSVSGTAPVFATAPGCALAAARLAGRADLGGTLMQVSVAGVSRCYAQAGQVALGDGDALVQYRTGARTVTVLGAGTLMTNRELGNAGNAALALNLLSGTGRVVWLVPVPIPARALGPAGQGGSGPALIPGSALLVTAQLAVAVLLAALWRMRRFGPLVTEPIPVVVRASETTEGHARLYQSRHSRGRAAAALRAATTGRLLPRLALPRDAPAGMVCAELARRTGRDAGQIEALLYGPAPADDGALVALAADLDTLEGEVLIK